MKHLYEIWFRRSKNRIVFYPVGFLGGFLGSFIGSGYVVSGECQNKLKRFLKFCNFFTIFAIISIVLFRLRASAILLLIVFVGFYFFCIKQLLTNAEVVHDKPKFREVTEDMASVLGLTKIILLFLISVLAICCSIIYFRIEEAPIFIGLIVLIGAIAVLFQSIFMFCLLIVKRRRH